MRFTKINATDKMWYVETDDIVIGVYLVSFDKKTVYDLWEDSDKLTEEEKAILKHDNPVMYSLLFDD